MVVVVPDDELLDESSFLEHETTVRLKRDIKIMCKILFIFYLNTKSKILLVRRTRGITSIGLFYKKWDFTWRMSDCEELVGSIIGNWR